MPPIPSGFLSCPVLITLTSGRTGSGFYFEGPNYVYLITACHVLYDTNGRPYTNCFNALSLPTTHAGQKNLLEFNLSDLQHDSTIFIDQQNDIAAIQVANIPSNVDGPIIQGSLSTGITKLHATDIDLTGPRYNQVRPFNDVVLSSDVFILGYPTSIGLKSTPRFDYEAPLLRKGIVAGKYEIEETLILDSPVYYGNSGGPVIDTLPYGLTTHQFCLIGIVTEFIEYQEKWRNVTNNLENIQNFNSGYSVAVSVNKLFNLLNIQI